MHIMHASASIIWCAGLLVLFIPAYHAHVRLIYPPARKYDFDTLGSRTTPSGCGMPPGENSFTDLQAGSTFNVTWNVGGPHDGGFRVELLDKSYNLISTLVPAGGNVDQFYGDNPVQNTQQVFLPKDITCTKCILRVKKRGGNPSTQMPQPNLFFTCADVNIVEDDPKQKCSNRGKWSGAGCNCQEPFVGDICQYADECVRDSDCSNGGKCIDTKAISYPKKQCYCPFGWHGVACAKESSIKSFSFSPDMYQTRSSQFQNFLFFWRILDDIGEIEVVVQAKSNNWFAVGWRPDSSNTTCKMFPKILPEKSITFSKDGRLVENTIDYFDVNGPFIAGPLHPMACNDIVYATALGNYSRIRDMYTRDHATPREDTVYDGKDDLTAALAYEDQQTGFATLIFRKKLEATEMADQSVTDTVMHVIWAIGQKPYDVLANTESNEIPQQASQFNKPIDPIKSFYRKGELNSHAHSPKTRGVFKVNLLLEK